MFPAWITSLLIQLSDLLDQDSEMQRAMKDLDSSYESNTAPAVTFPSSNKVTPSSNHETCEQYYVLMLLLILNAH